MRALISILILIAGTQVFAAEPTDTCFWADQIWDFRIVNDRTIVVREGGPRQYRIDVSFCNNISWAQRIAFRGFGNNICQNDEVFIYEDYFSNRPDQICRIRRITRI